MVKHLTLAIMEDNTPIFLGPDATCEGRTLRVLEAAGNHHTGAGQGTESERNVSSQNVDHYKETNKPWCDACGNKSTWDITWQQDEFWENWEVHPLSFSWGSLSSNGFSYSGKKNSKSLSIFFKCCHREKVQHFGICLLSGRVIWEDWYPLHMSLQPAVCTKNGNGENN